MDKKECIEFLKGITFDGVPNKDWNEYIKCIIERLQMWEDFKKEYGAYIFSPNLTIEDILNRFEQKCSPNLKIRKEVKVEVLAENEDVIDELTKGIEDMNGQIFCKGKIRIITTRWERD